jgi:ubiquinone/menaquinone biosynthesis C-methylase UbiE
MPPDQAPPRRPICDYEGSDYQTSFWDQAGRDYEDQAEAIALRRLLPPGGDLLLETGAGAGRNTPRYTGYRHIVLLDYSLSQLQAARQRLGADEQFIYVAGDAYNLPFVSGLFDTATMIRVIHHMADAPHALGDQRRVLQAGGALILEFASKLHLKAISRYLLRRQSWSPFNREPVEFAELNFDFHPAAMRQWLTEAGFTVERQLTVSHFRLRTLKRLLPTSLLVRMDSAAQLTGDLWQLSPSVFVRARASSSGPRAQPEQFFRCPDCGESLPGDPRITHHRGEIDCPACERRWEIRDGIYVFK